METAPKSAEYRYHFGLALLVNGDAQRAATEFEAVLQLEPDFQLARDRVSEIRGADEAL